MNDSEPREYKSPTRKLVKFFHKSRDQWKAKCIDTKATVKRLKNRVRYLEASKEEWKNRALALEKGKHSVYPSPEESIRKRLTKTPIQGVNP